MVLPNWIRLVLVVVGLAPMAISILFVNGMIDDWPFILYLNIILVRAIFVVGGLFIVLIAYGASEKTSIYANGKYVIQGEEDGMCNTENRGSSHWWVIGSSDGGNSGSGGGDGGGGG